MNKDNTATQKSTLRDKLNNLPSRNKKIIALIFTVSIIVIIGAVSYAYLPTDDLPNEPVDAQASTATLKLKYTDCASTNQSDCADISADLEPGNSITKTFEVENVGTQEVMYDIYFRELENSFKNGDLVYSLENIATGEYLVTEKVIPEGTKTNVSIKRKISSPVGSKVQYRLTVTFLNRDYEQSDNYDATFGLKLKITEAQKGAQNTMAARVSGEGDNLSISKEGFWSHSADIKRIAFEDSLNPKENAAYSYDLTDSKYAPGSIMAYLIPEESDNTKYTAYIQGDGGVGAPINSMCLFAAFIALESIDGMENLDTINVTNMYGMFMNCSSLTALDLSNFDTNSVTNMSFMVAYCSNLASLDLSNFNTSNVTDMRKMFGGCSSLTSLDLSNFNTSNVVNMPFMFGECSNLTSLDLSSFDTSNVIDMGDMFGGCSNLTSLDLSNFDTSNVINMSSMFAYSNNLTSLNLSSFDTNNVVSMQYMFSGCTDLSTSITVSGTKCKEFSEMFDSSATQNGAQIIVNYTEDASSLVDQMIATKSNNSNVVKGSVITQ